MIIGTVTTGAAVASNFKLNYLPAYLYFIVATQLSSLKVTVAGDGVIVDLDADGINGVSGIRRLGAVANSYLIPLADGFIPNKVVDIDIINSAAQTPIIYGFALQTGLVYITSTRQTVLASSGTTFKDFSHLSITSMGATDELNIGFVDGHVQKFNSVELLGWVTLYSNEVDSYVIDNIAGNINWVTLTPAANRVVVVTSVRTVGSLE